MKASKEKATALHTLLTELGSVLVAYSGGVDSTLLLRVALDTLGRERVLAVTAQSETYPQSEVEAATELASRLGARHLLISTEELKDQRFAHNPPDRCYYCKHELFRKLTEIAKREGLNAVCDGANYDDLGDFRPGMRAGAELGVRSPLKEVGLTKEETRQLSKELGLPTWDKPSYACLASRFPYGTEITPEQLRRIEEAESFLRSLGIGQLRVRHHGEIARIEVSPADFPRLFANGMRERVITKLRSLGYTYVTIDLQGYRTGSMNETLGQT